MYAFADAGKSGPRRNRLSAAASGHLLLAWYLDRVLPTANGVHRSACFCVPNCLHRLLPRRLLPRRRGSASQTSPTFISPPLSNDQACPTTPGQMGKCDLFYTIQFNDWEKNLFFFLCSCTLHGSFFFYFAGKDTIKWLKKWKRNSSSQKITQK